MNNIKTLNMLPVGQSTNVKKVLSRGDIRRRLRDIGLIEGTKVSCLQISPPGDPTAYLIRGAVIALRCEDSSNIIIE
ncbi:MAG: ferrous iron transport protein A [Oscillospiraceae bacterium]|nr:ferrous iron transport protein A [Oscillospiraceae bacterium]